MKFYAVFQFPAEVKRLTGIDLHGDFQKGLDTYSAKLARERVRGVKDHPFVTFGRTNIALISEEEKRKGNAQHLI